MNLEDLFNIAIVGSSTGFIICCIAFIVSFLVGWLVRIIRTI